MRELMGAVADSLAAEASRQFARDDAIVVGRCVAALFAGGRDARPTGGRFFVKPMMINKTVESLSKAHYAQVRSYLKATGLEQGILVNFAAEKADFRRVEQ